MIQDARYTSPSGKEAVFSWEKGKRKTTLKTGVYTFPSRDGAHVQHQGAGDRTFPLVCIFSGSDCMEKADAFEAMLIERGTAELQHPLYGTLKVVPTGDIEREDDPVNKNGESTVTITFTETIDDEEAAGLNEVAAEAIDEKFEEFSEAAAAGFAEAIAVAGDDDANLSDQLAVQAALEAQTQSIIDNLEPLARADKKKFSDWIASVKELKDKIKNLYKKGMGYAGKVESLYVKALNIARLTLRLMKLPSDLSVSLAEKIKGYANLTANLINQYKNDSFGIEKIKNAYATARLAITGAVAAIASGSALTVTEVAAMTGATLNSISSTIPGTSTGTENNMSTGTMSREEALETSGKITAILDSVIAFRDEKIASMETSGEDTPAVTQLVDDTITFMNETIAELENAISAEISPVVIQFVNELIDSKNNEMEKLRESIGRSANRSAHILENAIGLEEEIRIQIETAGEATGETVRQIVQIIDDSLAFENENKDRLELMASKETSDFVDSSPVSHLALYEVVYDSVLFSMCQV
jgi:hypothetical protein